MELAAPIAQPMSPAWTNPRPANYFIGNDPPNGTAACHLRQVSMRASIRHRPALLRQPAPIGIRLRGCAWGSPKPIRLQFVGANSSILLTMAIDRFSSERPDRVSQAVVYQLKDGVRQPIEGQFDCCRRTQSLHAGPLRPFEAAVIDQCSLIPLPRRQPLDVAYGIAADSSATPMWSALLFPRIPVQTGSSALERRLRQGCVNVFVAKLNPAGTALVYSTYLGGSGVGSGCCAYGDYGKPLPWTAQATLM